MWGVITLMSPPPPPYIGQSSRLGDAVEGCVPTLLTKITPWPAPIEAASRLTPARLASLVTSLGPVRIGISSTAPDATHEFWNVDKDAAAAAAAHEHGFLVRRPASETSVAAMPIEQFWQPASNASTRAVHYYSGSLLEDDGRASLPDLQTGLDELIAALGGERDAGTKASGTSLKVWLGTAGATTPLHYDTQHNVYAQLHGTKEFWLWPPRATRRSVQLYPRIHPLSHFQRGFGAGGGSAETTWASDGSRFGVECFGGSFNLHDGEGECALRIRLNEGDVIYVPPFWLHRATCRDSCISTNVWVASQPMRRMEEIKAMPLPFEGGWPLPTRYAAVLAFLRAMLRHVHAAEASLSRAYAARRASSPPPPPDSESWKGPDRALTPTEVVHGLLSTRWHQAEASLFRVAAVRRSSAHEAAGAAVCEPRGGNDYGLHDYGSRDYGDGTVAEEVPDMAKINSYARRSAEVFGVGETSSHAYPHVGWRGPKLILVHDQLERIAHWATGGDARATYALLSRLLSCCAAQHGVDGHDEL